MDASILNSGLSIICVGAVFNSWDLLERGFVEVLSKHLRNFLLLKLKQCSAFGAAKYAAKRAGDCELPIGSTTELLFSYSATSTGYLANGNHVRANGNHTNGAHSNGNGIEGQNRQQRQEQNDDDDGQAENGPQRSNNNCTVI